MREEMLRKEEEIRAALLQQSTENTNVLAGRVSALETELDAAKEEAKQLAEQRPVAEIAHKLEDCERVLDTTVEEHKKTLKMKEAELSNRLQAEVNSKNLLNSQINKLKA